MSAHDGFPKSLEPHEFVSVCAGLSVGAVKSELLLKGDSFALTRSILLDVNQL